jgi:hypothetical protein
VRDDTDFRAYVDARWPALLATLVHLGVPGQQARTALVCGLARCRPDWGDVRQDADLDVVVLRAAVESIDLESRDAALRQALLDHTVDELEDVDPTPDHRGIVDRERDDRRRRRRLVAVSLAALTALLVVAAGVSWAVTRPEPPPELTPVAVEEEPNPLDTVWQADGRLHLPRVTLALPDLERMVPVRDGAVYSDTATRVVLVRGDGSREVIGHQARGAPLASSTRRGLVAWVEPGPTSALLRVYDALTHRYLPGLTVPLTTEPIAVLGGSVLYRAPDAAYAWELPDGTPRRVHGDLAEGYSDSGSFALSYSDDGAPNSLRGRLVITDVRTGQPVDAGIQPDEVVIDATLGPDDDLLYVSSVRDQLPGAGEYLRLSFSGPLAVNRCSLTAAVQGTPECEQLARLPRNSNVPVLPRG